MRTRRLLPLLLVPVLVLAACGDDDAASAPPTTPVPATDEGPDRDDGRTPTGSPDVCAEAIAWVTAAGAAFAPPTDPSTAGGLEETLRYFERLADTAPAEIRSDMETFASYFAQYVAALESVDYDFTRLLTDPEAMAAFEALEDPAFEEAADNISAWFDAHCGVED